MLRTAIAALLSITARLSRNATLIALVSVSLAAAEPSPFISDTDWSQPKAATSTSSDAAPASPGKALATMALAMVAILGLGAGALVLIKRIGSRRNSLATPRHLSVVETVPLGMKRTLSVLRIGDQVVLVGNHEHGMTSLGMLPASVLSAAGGPTPEGANVASATVSAPPMAPLAATRAGFASVLENLIGKR